MTRSKLEHGTVGRTSVTSAQPSFDNAAPVRCSQVSTLRSRSYSAMRSIDGYESNVGHAETGVPVECLLEALAGPVARLRLASREKSLVRSQVRPFDTPRLQRLGSTMRCEACEKCAICVACVPRCVRRISPVGTRVATVDQSRRFASPRSV